MRRRSKRWVVTASPAILKKRKTRKWIGFRTDPVGFVREVLGAEPTPYQEEILRALATKRAAVRGPHGLGKTAVAAWAVLWFANAHREAKVVTTASAWRQLTHFLWPEIHKWARGGDWDRTRARPELFKDFLRMGNKCEAFAAASDRPELMEGAHSAHLLYVLDEAKAIPDATWDAIEGALAAGDCYALAISTPGGPAGRFYEIHRRAPGLTDWWVRHVTMEEAVAANRVSAGWVEERRKQWGEDSPVFQQRVRGEFPKQAVDALFSLAWIEAARERA